jgi:hypothetical protein
MLPPLAACASRALTFGSASKLHEEIKSYANTHTKQTFEKRANLNYQIGKIAFFLHKRFLHFLPARQTDVMGLPRRENRVERRGADIGEFRRTPAWRLRLP